MSIDAAPATKPLNLIGPLRSAIDLEMLPSDTFTSATVTRTLEYLSGPDRIVFMNDLYRVLKIGAQVTMMVPYYSHPRSFADPRIQWPPISEHSFLFFDAIYRDNAGGLERYGIACDFACDVSYEMTHAYARRSDSARTAALENYWGVCPEMWVVLTKRQVGKPVSDG